MNMWQLTQYYQDSFYPHKIQNNWMTHFSPANFLIHAACLQQHVCNDIVYASLILQEWG